MTHSQPFATQSQTACARRVGVQGVVCFRWPSYHRFGVLFAVVTALAAGGCSPDASSASRNEQMRIEELASKWKPYQAPRDPANLFDRNAGNRPQIDPSMSPSSEVEARPLWKVPAFQEWDLPQTAEDSLARIGEDAVPAVAQGLRHPDPQRRVQAARILARIGPSAAKAVPTLIVALEDQRPEVRKAVARALGQIGPAASAAVQPLLRTIESSPESEEH